MAASGGTSNLIQLQARWRVQEKDGISRRDALLTRLRASGDAVRNVEKDLRGIPLVQEDLSGMDFSRCDLRGADLTGAQLADAQFSWAQMQGASLNGAQIDRCQFLGADLTEANLNECRGARVSFGASTLAKATLFGAVLQESTCSKAKLPGADLRTAVLAGSRLRETDLRGASLAEADLQSVDLTDARIDGAHLDGADLQEASLRGIKGYLKASWVSTDIRHVDFCGAYLVRRHIMDENYLHEFRNRGTQYEVLYQLWKLTSDCGRSLTRWGLFILAIALVFAGLYSLVAIDYGDYPSALSPFYFSIVTLTTLGYGDVLPASTAAQVLVIIEVTSGYVALGGMLSIFANKMARRAE